MVKFIGALEWAKANGYYTEEKGFDVNMPDMFCVLKGRKEYVVECDQEIRMQLEQLPNDSFLFQKMKVATDYLDKHNIPYSIAGKASVI